jgi:PEP-CTERM motif
MNVSGKAVATLTLALAVLVFPIAAIADNSISWSSSAASISASAGGLSFSNSTVTDVTLGNGTTLSGNLGTLSLTGSGSLVSGSLTNGCAGGCSFLFANSSFKISGSGGGPGWTGEVTPNTDVTLKLDRPCVGTTCTYTITASLSSSNGQPVGFTVLNFATNGKFTGGSFTTSRAGGFTDVTVPEPGTLGLLGVGLFCLAGVLRHQLVRS